MKTLEFTQCERKEEIGRFGAVVQFDLHFTSIVLAFGCFKVYVCAWVCILEWGRANKDINKNYLRGTWMTQ